MSIKPYLQWTFLVDLDNFFSLLSKKMMLIIFNSEDKTYSINERIYFSCHASIRRNNLVLSYNKIKIQSRWKRDREREREREYIWHTHFFMLCNWVYYLRAVHLYACFIKSTYICIHLIRRGHLWQVIKYRNDLPHYKVYN